MTDPRFRERIETPRFEPFPPPAARARVRRRHDARGDGLCLRAVFRGPPQSSGDGLTTEAANTDICKRTGEEIGGRKETVVAALAPQRNGRQAGMLGRASEGRQQGLRLMGWAAGQPAAPPHLRSRSASG